MQGFDTKVYGTHLPRKQIDAVNIPEKIVPVSTPPEVMVDSLGPIYNGRWC